MSMPPMEQSFACPQCGQPFAWQAQHAGRKLVCACGTLIRIPDSLEPPPESYALAGEESPAAGQIALDARGEGIPTAAVAAAAPSRVLAYGEGARARASHLPEWVGTDWRDLWIPIGVIALSSLAIVIVCGIVWTGTGAFPHDQLFNLSIRIVWDLSVTIIMGVFIAWLFDTSMGVWWIALLKLTALSMARFAVWAVVAVPGGNILAEMVGFALSFPVMWFLLCFLFELDFRDGFFGAILITLLRWVSYLQMWKLLR